MFRNTQDESNHDSKLEIDNYKKSPSRNSFESDSSYFSEVSDDELSTEKNNTDEDNLQNKTKNNPAPKSKSLDLFSVCDETQNENDEDSDDYCHEIQILKKNSSQTKYVFKKYKLIMLSEIEAFNGFCFRLLLGDRHPKIRSVHDVNGKQKGCVSKLINNYTCLEDFKKKYGSLTIEQMIQFEIIKILVAAYTEEENDLHHRNYGLDGDMGFMVKIDDDKATSPLTYKLIKNYFAYFTKADVDGDLGIEDDPDVYLTEEKDPQFNVTANDISTFPILTDAYPHTWVTTNLMKADFPRDWLTTIVKDKKFIDDKNYMFLKRILIPSDAFKAIGNATLSLKKIKDSFVEHKINKTQELKDVLLTDSQFLYYVIYHPEIIDQILLEFNQNNLDYKKPEDHYLHVNLEKIRESYNEVYQYAKSLEFMLNAQFIAALILAYKLNNLESLSNLKVKFPWLINPVMLEKAMASFDANEKFYFRQWVYSGLVQNECINFDMPADLDIINMLLMQTTDLDLKFVGNGVSLNWLQRLIFEACYKKNSALLNLLYWKAPELFNPEIIAKIVVFYPTSFENSCRLKEWIYQEIIKNELKNCLNNNEMNLETISLCLSQPIDFFQLVDLPNDSEYQINLLSIGEILIVQAYFSDNRKLLKELILKEPRLFNENVYARLASFGQNLPEWVNNIKLEQRQPSNKTSNLSLKLFSKNVKRYSCNDAEFSFPSSKVQKF